MKEPPSLTEREISDAIDELMKQQETLKGTRLCKPVVNQCADHVLYRESTIVNTGANILSIRMNEQILWKLEQLKPMPVKPPVRDEEIEIEAQAGEVRVKGRGVAARVFAVVVAALAFYVVYQTLSK